MVSDGLDFSSIASTAPLNLKSLKSWNIFETRWQRDFVPVEIDVEIGKTSFQAPSVWLFCNPPPWVCLKIHTSRKLFGGLRAYLIKNSRQFLVPKRSEIRHTHIANGTEALHSLQRGHCMTSHPQSMHHSKESIKFEHRSYSIKFHPPQKKNGSHLVTPLLKQFWKKEKESKHLFPKLPKNHSLFSSRFLGLPWHAHSQEKLLRSNIPRLKKKAKEWLQVVLREFWSLGVICIFSKWNFVLVFHFIFGSHCMNAWISLIKVIVFVKRQRFLFTTKNLPKLGQIWVYQGLLYYQPKQSTIFLRKRNPSKLPNILHSLMPPQN